MTTEKSSSTHVVSKLEQIRAAHKAVDAWEQVVLAAQEALGAGPQEGIIPGAGTCVMTQAPPANPAYTYADRETFACSECKRTTDATDWKFCAFCGAEVVRFQRSKHEESRNIRVVVHTAETEPEEGGRRP